MNERILHVLINKIPKRFGAGLAKYILIKYLIEREKKKELLEMMTEAEQPVLVNTQESSVSSGSDSEIKGKSLFDCYLLP